jgi:hypothetical protein
MNSTWKFAGALLIAVAGPVFASSSVEDLLKSAGGVLDSRSSGTTRGSAFSDAEVDGALKDALGVGAQRAIALLGREGGYLDDSQVRIRLPKSLRKAGDLMDRLGYGEVVTEFEEAVNRAAERAIPQTLDIVEQTVREMTLEDVQGILSGGDDAATTYLRKRAGDRLHEAILPVVRSSTDEAGATAAYKKFANQAAKSTGGLVSAESLDLDDYVADKALDGLFVKLAAEEREIRRNPAARSTELLKKVFGGG